MSFDGSSSSGTASMNNNHVNRFGLPLCS